MKIIQQIIKGKQVMLLYFCHRQISHAQNQRQRGKKTADIAKKNATT
jgi:hypothetical protein